MNTTEIECTRCESISHVILEDDDYLPVRYCPCCGEELIEDLDFSR